MVVGSDVMFGDGYYGVLVDKLPHPSDKNKCVCTMIPREKTVEAYGLKLDDARRDRVKGTWSIVYSEDDVIPFPHGDRGTSYLFLCNWWGQETRLVEKLNLALMATCKYLRNENAKLKLQVAMVFRDAKRITSMPEPYRQKFNQEYIRLINASGEKQVRPVEEVEGAEF